MAKEVLRNPGCDRTLVTKAKVLNFLSDGQPHGHREIRRHTAMSPTTVNKFLIEWTTEGKVDKFMQGKWPKYRIIQQGRDELTRLNEIIAHYNKHRLTSKVVSVTVIPTTGIGNKKFPILVLVGATKGTPDPLSQQTQKTIEQLMAPVEDAIQNVLDYTKADSLEVHVVVGSPSPEKTWKKQ